MSIKRIQTERRLEEVTRALHATGVRPMLNDIFTKVARHFSQYPAGRPLALPVGVATANQPSDVRAFNQALANIAENLDVLYEVALEHVDDVLMLTTTLQTYLQKLKAQQRRIETKVDDYLLSLSNTDGYYYAVSDTFSDVGMTDLTLTSAHVDTAAGQVAIPSVGALTRRVPRALVGNPSLQVSVGGQRESTLREIAAFSGAIEDGLDNEIWAVEVETTAVTEIVLQVSVPLGSAQNVIDLSRIDIVPYGVTPTQVFVDTLAPPDPGTTGVVFESFGNRISTSVNRMVFADQVRRVGTVRFNLRKTSPDYTVTEGGVTRHRYIFGAREITFLYQVYDNEARFVSSRLSLPEELNGELVIDAVSLVVDDQEPPDTSIGYWIAADDNEATTVDEFDWRRIVPVGSEEANATTAVRFEGAVSQLRSIRSNAVTPDLMLLPSDAASGDPRTWNPSPAVIPGVDIWRICTFDEDVLPTSVRLEEGVNTVRIAYLDLNPLAVESLGFWADVLRDPATRTAYGRIDVGNDFLYGGDVGESDVSLFAETYVESDTERPTFLAECYKPDPNSQTWDVRVFLNGREIGFLPQGTHRALLPWTLRQGINHVVILASVPAGRSTGTINLMGDSQLYEYGTVKLATWSYVSLFDLSYNTSGTPTTFTIHNGELISRRQPTDNLRLRWAKSTGRGPQGIRLRADLSRDINNPTVSPRLSSYRLRFAFAQEAS